MITDVTVKTELMAEVVIAIGYRDTEYDVEGIVAEIARDHGRVSVSDLDPHTFAAILARHRH